MKSQQVDKSWQQSCWLKFSKNEIKLTLTRGKGNILTSKKEDFVFS